MANQPDPICFCFEVYEPEIRQIVKEKKVKTLEEFNRYCQAGQGCGTCRPDVVKIIAEMTGRNELEIENPDLVEMNKMRKEKLQNKG